MNTTPLLELLSHTAMKGAAVLLVALLLGLILRKTAASRRYAIWLTAIAALAVLPLAMWALPAWRVLPKASAGQEWPAFEPEVRTESEGAIVMATSNRVVSSAAKTELQEPGPAAAPPSFSWEISWQDVVSKLPLVWMLIAGGFLLRLGLSAWRLHRLEATLTPGEFAVVAQTARELGLKRLPRLFVGPPDAVPMVWGVLRHRLLLPQGFESWSGEKQRGVLLHELAHLKRGDPLALWMAQWVKALHWFNPLAWLTLRQLRADQERACDDTVLRQGVRASDYAQSLLDLSRHNRLAPGLSLCALTITRCAPVEARVKAILDPSRRRDPLTVRWLAGLGGGALLITLPVAMLHAIEGTKLRGRILDRNGVVLAESTKEKVRSYPLKTLAAHSVGYIRRSDANETTWEGRAGIEKQQDAALKAGKDVKLTFDARIQSLALHAMRDGGVEHGAAVVMDPRTGEILSMVSIPSFDLNTFIPSIRLEDWKRYLEDRDYPLFDRCLSGMYSPGATFIPLTALAGISAGVGDKSFDCQVPRKGPEERFACWRVRQGKEGHGVLNMTAAVLNSCSSYWYQYGRAAGFASFGTVGRKIGFGQSYHVLEGDQEGILPTQEWWEQRRRGREAWTEEQTANLAVGFGYVQVTPLQMATLAATVANGGHVPQPHLMADSTAQWRADLVQEGLPAAQIEQLREGMRLVVNGTDGTGKLARSEKMIIAGQTGTTQSVSRDAKGELKERNHAWFIGFAPFEKPTLAFAILKQGGKSGGSDCAPVAKRIVEEALALPADGSGEVRPVEEPTNIEEGNRKAEAVPKPLETIKTTPAKVIDRSAETMFSSLMIDKGSLDGIVADSPVVTANGLVGKTATPEPHSTKVILLTDKLCFVSAKVQGGIEQGIVNGESAAHEARRQLRLRFLSRDAKINKGSSVYSSGEGGVFPAGLLLGRVELFKKGDFSGEATVEPAVDFSTLDLVFVIETKPAGEETTPSPQPDGQAQLRQQSDADIRMKPELAKQWAALKRAGLLADLPASARPFDLGGKHPERQVKSVREFRFWTSRADVRRWLADSHCFPAKADPLASRHSLLWEPPAVEDIAADWPAPPEPFGAPTLPPLTARSTSTLLTVRISS